ncbi:MAG: precorrin-6y C5,15-methyltransferase (decarboxylating) subunit CbiE [Proteocatella sp.]
MKSVKIIGTGMGNSQHLTQKAREALENAQEILTTDTLAVRLNLGDRKIVQCSISDITDRLLKSSSSDIAVLVSGDVNFFSLSKTIKTRLEKLKSDASLDEDSRKSLENMELEFINGISSMQYFFAKLQKSYDDVKLTSAHGRNTNIVALASYNKKVFSLTGGEQKAHTICAKLTQAGLGQAYVTIGENLGNPQERILSGKAQDFASMEIQNLAVMLIENPEAVESYTMLKDADFERAKVPMTKEEVRWISVNKLEIRPADIVYDIGAGTGSVTMDMARKANEATVYAVEQKPEAIELIKKNIKRTGCYNVELVQSKAPEGMKLWPAPDRVFIGGSSGNLKQILESVILKREDKSSASKVSVDCTEQKLKIVINTITLETLVETYSCLEILGFENVEYLSMTTAKSQKMGNYNLMMGANPVYVISADYISR